MATRWQFDYRVILSTNTPSSAIGRCTTEALDSFERHTWTTRRFEMLLYSLQHLAYKLNLMRT